MREEEKRRKGHKGRAIYIVGWSCDLLLKFLAK
jgi:hypothetical protein